MKANTCQKFSLNGLFVLLAAMSLFCGSSEKKEKLYEGPIGKDLYQFAGYGKSKATGRVRFMNECRDAALLQVQAKFLNKRERRDGEPNAETGFVKGIRPMKEYYYQDGTCSIIVRVPIKAVKRP